MNIKTTTAKVMNNLSTRKLELCTGYAQERGSYEQVMNKPIVCKLRATLPMLVSHASLPMLVLRVLWMLSLHAIHGASASLITFSLYLFFQDERSDRIVLINWFDSLSSHACRAVRRDIHVGSGHSFFGRGKLSLKLKPFYCVVVTGTLHDAG